MFEQYFFFGWLLQERFCRCVVYVKKRMLEKKIRLKKKRENMGKIDKKWEKKKWNEMKLEKVKIEKQNESNGKSTRMSSKTLCLTASHANQKKKICVWYVFSWTKTHQTDQNAHEFIHIIFVCFGFVRRKLIKQSTAPPNNVTSCVYILNYCKY